MIATENRTRKKYLNFEGLSDDLEEMISRISLRAEHSLSGLEEIFAKGKNEFLDLTKKFTQEIDFRVNTLVNDALDTFNYGKIENIDYEEIKSFSDESVREQKGKCMFEEKYFSNLPAVKDILSGKFCNLYSIKDKKPKRLWKWKDRLNYLEGFFNNYNKNENEKEIFEELRTKIGSNYYLKKNHKDIYEKLSMYFTL
ncbi:MAG: hypothetical protein ACP5N2_03340 [Candidatus Nanoarchaeia archaeon]